MAWGIQLKGPFTKRAISLLLLALFHFQGWAQVGPPPVITAQPLDTNVIFGGTATFTVAASSGTTLSYQWYKKGTSSNTPLTSNSTNLVLPDVTDADAGQYLVTVKNASGTVTSRNANLTIINNLAPIATNDNYSTLENTSLVVPAKSGVLTNDIDRNGLPLMAQLLTNVAHGSLTFSNGGSFIYFPNTNYVGSDSFSYYAADSASAMIEQCNSANDAMQLNNGDISSQSFCHGAAGSPSYTISKMVLYLSRENKTKAGTFNVSIGTGINSGTITGSVVSVPQTNITDISQGETFQTYEIDYNPPLGPFSAGTNYYLNLGNETGKNVYLQINDSGGYANGSLYYNGANQYSDLRFQLYSTNISSPATVTLNITTNFPPTITTQPVSITTIVGQNVSFSVVATGTAPLTYQWYFNNDQIGGPAGQGTTLTLNNVNNPQTGNYFVVIHNNYGSVTSAIVTLTVGTLPGIQTQPANQIVVQGQNATFSVIANGSAPYTYQWNFAGTNILNATNISLTLTNVQPVQAGSYKVIVGNSYGSSTSAVAMLTVNNTPFITNQPASLVVTQAQNASFTVGAGGTAPLQYHWFFNGAPTPGPGATLMVNNATTNNAGNYMVVVKNNYGSVTSVVAILTVTVPPSIATQPVNQSAIPGQSASFSVVATGDAALIYRWTFNANDIAGATNSTLTLTNVQSNQAGNYQVVVTNFVGAVTSAVASLTVYVPPAITTQPISIATNNGQAVSFTVVATGSPTPTYQWYFNNNPVPGPAGKGASLSLNNVNNPQAGNYFVVVSNPGGSVTSSVVTLTVGTLPGIQTQPQNQNVIQGQNTSFSVTANGTSPYSYQWNFYGTNILNATNSFLALTNVQAIQAGNYTVAINNQYGSVTSQVATLVVNVSAFITNQPASLVVTQDQTAVFSVGAGGTPNLQYQWFFNGAPTPGPGATLTVNNAKTNNTGNYIVVVHNNYGAITSAVVNLLVVAPPIIIHQPTNQSIMQGKSFALAVSANGSLLNYQWEFKSVNIPGATNSILNLSNVQTNDTGDYQVVVTNLAGAAVSSVATLTVMPLNVTLSTGSTGGLSANGFTFQLSVPAGHTYVIQASTDMVNWTPIYTNSAAADNPTFTDPQATNYPSCFYRAAVW